MVRDDSTREHPGAIGRFGTTALVMGGSNQNLFLIGALMISQGTAAIPLLVAGLALGWMAIFIPSAEFSALLGARLPFSARLVTTPS